MYAASWSWGRAGFSTEEVGRTGSDMVKMMEPEGLEGEKRESPAFLRLGMAEGND